MKTDIPYLPDDIMTNILERLPVKSLIRFQCVSKSWNNIFKTSSFISKHIFHSSQQNSYLLSHLSSRPSDSPNFLYLLDHNIEFRRLNSINSPLLINPRASYKFDSSCYGLLCLKNCSNKNEFVLWNPAIGEYMILPQPTVVSDDKNDCVHGFGFDPVANEFKILRFFSKDIKESLEGEIYTLSRGLWERFIFKINSNSEDSYTISRKHFSVNGFIFWFGRTKVEDRVQEVDDVIIAFHIERGKMAIISLPTTTPYHGLCCNVLTSYENKLAIFFPMTVGNFVESDSYKIDVWVLEECAASSMERWRWTNIFTTGPNPHDLIIYPQCIWRNEIVCTVFGKFGEYRLQIVLCNLTTGEYSFFDIPEYCYEIYQYVEVFPPLNHNHIH